MAVRVLLHCQLCSALFFSQNRLLVLPLALSASCWLRDLLEYLRAASFQMALNSGEEDMTEPSWENAIYVSLLLLLSTIHRLQRKSAWTKAGAEYEYKSNWYFPVSQAEKKIAEIPTDIWEGVSQQTVTYPASFVCMYDIFHLAYTEQSLLFRSLG